MLMDMLILIVLTVVALEGVAIMALAAPITIEGIGTMLESTMQMFGLQLTVLAILTMLCWIFREDGSLPKMQRFMFVVLTIPGSSDPSSTATGMNCSRRTTMSSPHGSLSTDKKTGQTSLKVSSNEGIL